MNPKLRLLAAVLLALPLVACVASDDGDHVTVVPEYEPNDASTNATKLNGGAGYYSFFGQCSAATSDSYDWFEVDAAGSGPIESTLHVFAQEPGGPQGEAFTAAATPVIALSVMDAANAVIGEAPEVTPSAPARIDAVLPGAGTIRMKLTCPAVDAWYGGTIRLP